MGQAKRRKKKNKEKKRPTSNEIVAGYTPEQKERLGKLKLKNSIYIGLRRGRE
jgi:hypothetical protein